MPRGAYTAKQERKADHIEKGYRRRGVSKKEAEERAWRTVNKQDKGGRKSGSGRGRSGSSSRSSWRSTLMWPLRMVERAFDWAKRKTRKLV